MKFNIAIVDDSASFLALVKHEIGASTVAVGNEDLNIVLDTFEKGRYFFTSLEKKNYDLILIDYEMPTMNGIQTHQILQKTDPNVQVCFLAGNVPDELLVYQKKEPSVFIIEKNSSYLSSILNISRIIAERQIENNKVVAGKKMIGILKILIYVLLLSTIILLYFNFVA